MNKHIRTIFYIIPTLILTSLRLSSLGQEVSIPDAGLNAAIREALQKPVGPLNERDLLSLIVLDARNRNVSSVEGLEAARNLVSLDLQSNLLANFSLPSNLTDLASLDLSINSLTNCFLPSGLTNLGKLILEANLLANITLPPDMQQLVRLLVDGNPLETLVLSETLAATNLADTVASLRNQGVSVFTYPLAVRLISPRLAAGAFELTLTGPPGIYTVLASSDLATWSELGTATNLLGSADFTDTTAGLSARKFYRARQ